MILLVTLSKSFCNSRIVLHHFGRFLENTSRKLLSSLWTFRVSRKKEKKARICHQTRIKRTFASAVHVDRVSFEVNNRGNRPSVLNISIIAVTGYTSTRFIFDAVRRSFRWKSLLPVPARWRAISEFRIPGWYIFGLESREFLEMLVKMGECRLRF